MRHLLTYGQQHQNASFNTEGLSNDIQGNNLPLFSLMHKVLNTVELGYNVMNGTEYFMSL
jgi:hypothetical protein